MTLCTAYLLREPTTTECEPGHVRHPESLKCEGCDQTYTVDYEYSCTDPSDLLKVVQVHIAQEHLFGHKQTKMEVPTRGPTKPS